MIAALYVDPKGPYPGLGVDCWDSVRDARTFVGPGPVIAHPPCGPWGQLRQFCTMQDPALGPLAVAQVRRCGGVLEHPAGSLLWAYCGLPAPGTEGEIPMLTGREWSLCVDQVRWGHRARKRTWLLFAGVRPSELPALPPLQEPSAVIRPRANGAGAVHVPRSQRHLTPPAFAAWLVAAVGTRAVLAADP